MEPAFAWSSTSVPIIAISCSSCWGSLIYKIVRGQNIPANIACGIDFVREICTGTTCCCNTKCTITRRRPINFGNCNRCNIGNRLNIVVPAIIETCSICYACTPVARIAMYGITDKSYSTHRNTFGHTVHKFSRKL